MKTAFLYSFLFHLTLAALILARGNVNARDSLKLYTIDLAIESGWAKTNPQDNMENVDRSSIIEPRETQDFLNMDSKKKRKAQKPSNAPSQSRKASFERTGEAPGSYVGIANGTKDAAHAAYAQIIRRKIALNWQSQFWSLNLLERKAKLSFILQRDGEAQNAKILESSGDSNFDLSCLRSIAESSPFPPLPENFNRPNLKIIFDFEITH